VTDDIAEQRKKKPEFGKQYGFLYPAAWRVLGALSRISPYSWAGGKSAIRADLYVVGFLLATTTALSWSTSSSWVVQCLIVFLCVYRYLDIMVVLNSILIRGFIKENPRGQGLASANRTVLLFLINGLELCVIFAALFLVLSLALPEVFSFKADSMGRIGALYYSVVTATSLGYGDIHPISSAAKILVTVEALSIFLVFVIVIASVVSQRKGIPDLE
jgi:hypothetical protein